MIGNEVDSLAHGLGGIGESVQPSVEVYAAMTHQRDMLLVDATLLHQMQHLGRIHPLDAASRMAYYHHLVDTELVDRHKQRAHGRVKRIGDGAPGILYHLNVTVAYAERRRKQLDQTCVHTCDDGDALVGILGCLELAVCPRLDKLAVVSQDFFYHIFKVIYVCWSC